MRYAGGWFGTIKSPDKFWISYTVIRYGLSKTIGLRSLEIKFRQQKGKLELREADALKICYSTTEAMVAEIK